MSLHLIDVVIPFHIFNSLVVEAIQSCHESVGIEVRIICVNDSGIPVTREELSLRKNDLLVSTSGKVGYTGAISVGVEESTAPFVGFLDSDDLTSSDRFAKQVHRLMSDNLDISSCRIIKITEKGREIKEILSFPKPPQFLGTELSILFGAYGSDSTLVCSGDFLRATWGSHKTFPPHLADYGWMMKECIGMRINFEATANYYYRMHPLQMSRKVNLQSDWVKIYPQWLKLLRSLSGLIPKTSQLAISSNVALLIAFPSSLISLTKSEKEELVEFYRSFQDEIYLKYKGTENDWKNFIDFRMFIGTRRFKHANLEIIVKIVLRVLSNFIARNSFRISKND